MSHLKKYAPMAIVCLVVIGAVAVWPALNVFGRAFASVKPAPKG